MLLSTFSHHRASTLCLPTPLIDRADRAVSSAQSMHAGSPRLLYGLLLCVALLLKNNSTWAEPLKVPASASETQRGKKLAPSRGETLQLAEGTTVLVRANAVLELEGKVPLPAGVGGYAFAARLTQGRIDVTVDPMTHPGNGVFIRAPRRTSVLTRAGRVAIAAGPTGVVVGAYEGKEVSVGIGASWRQLPAGNSMVVSPRTPAGMESKLLRPPARVVVNRPVIALEGGTDPVGITWDAVPGAQGYVLRLLDTNTNIQTSLESNEPSATLTGLSPGKYRLRVSSVEALGVEGMPSEPASVNVVGLALPPGAFISRRTLYLEPSQLVALTNVDGLEASYDTAPVYVKAPSVVGLRGTRPTTLHLRIIGSSERASIALAPRSLHTPIEILPAAARWPRDRIVIRIALPTNLADTPQIQVIPTVTVNSLPVSLNWVRNTKGLEAVIPAPPNYPGPWVLRAVVADQHGIVLARNFLEIGSMARIDDAEIPREIHRGGR